MLGTTRRSVLLFVIAMGAGLLAGCDLLGDTSRSMDEVDFLVVQEQGGKTGSLAFSPGDSLTLSLNNATDFQIGINLSCSSLEKMVDGGEWETVETNLVCALYLIQLPAGETHTKKVLLPTDDHVEEGNLEEGTYRYVTDVQDESEDGDGGAQQADQRYVTVATQSFEVVRE